ncbi:COG3650 family protein [Pseudomonas sp. LRF_L74]|uniref:COG3650 family protein n=1 Tax=Pseudomonas sp. LRF_L74 TaxID=3369422 RepID=UPI003F5D6055
MRLLIVLLPLLAGCQVYTGRDSAPPVDQRMQGELSRQGDQLLFQPCEEKRRFSVNVHQSDELAVDANSLFADGAQNLFVDFSGQLGPGSVADSDGQFTPGQVYRLQQDGPICNVANFDKLILQAGGDAPRWSVKVAGSGLVLQRAGQEPLALPYLEESLPGGSYNLSSEANGHKLDLWLAPQHCVDASSGDVQHLSAELRLDDQVLRGCAYFGGARNN